MAQLTPNQIYSSIKPRIPNISFAVWIDGEHKEYLDKIEKGKIGGKMAFPNWLCQKWQMKMRSEQQSADGSGIIQSLSNIITKTTGKIGETTETVTSPLYKTTSGTILGLQKGTFYTLLGITIIVGGYVVYKQYFSE